MTGPHTTYVYYRFGKYLHLATHATNKLTSKLCNQLRNSQKVAKADSLSIAFTIQERK